uniref:Uncharacterized protein n=1 Tax=Anguilla anguilla TaxID=7936 RepID=A0A0E9PKB8_ANGAN
MSESCIHHSYIINLSILSRLN